MALAFVHRNRGQGMYQVVVTHVEGASGSANGDTFAAADYVAHVFHAIRRNAATGNVRIQSSMNGTDWVTLTTINIANGSAEYKLDYMVYPYLRISYANIAVGTIDVVSCHAGGM